MFSFAENNSFLEATFASRKGFLAGGLLLGVFVTGVFSTHLFVLPITLAVTVCLNSSLLLWTSLSFVRNSLHDGHIRTLSKRLSRRSRSNSFSKICSIVLEPEILKYWHEDSTFQINFSRGVSTVMPLHKRMKVEVVEMTLH